jgi:alanine racemase
MDQMMIDVTEIPEAREGDEVIFVGGIIGIDEYADKCSLNRNEAWARIGRRVPRIFFEEGKPVLVSAEV